MAKEKTKSYFHIYAMYIMSMIKMQSEYTSILQKSVF